MTLTPAEALELAGRIRMDLTNAQGKLTDIVACLAAIPADQSTRPTPAQTIAKQIRNGALTDTIDLEAEIAGANIDEQDAEKLRELLAGVVRGRVSMREGLEGYGVAGELEVPRPAVVVKPPTVVSGA